MIKVNGSRSFVELRAFYPWLSEKQLRKLVKKMCAAQPTFLPFYNNATDKGIYQACAAEKELEKEIW